MRNNDVSASGLHHATPGEVQTRLAEDAGIIVLDVRTPEEYHGPTGHLDGARLLPVQELAERVDELDACRGRTVVVYCRSGVRSVAATRFLTAEGIHAVNMTGGILQWIAERRPVVHENPR
jgi:rhodanese-related sulfurtransferase